MNNKKVKFFAETMGLAPLSTRLKQTMIVFRGEEDVPKSKFGLSSLKLLNPKLGIPFWRGKEVIPKKVILTNLFNHKQTPPEAGWSVHKTQVQDFRNKDLTYNSHNGTDFSIPIGNTLLAAAPGEVVGIKAEFNRGGLKLIIDHGNGLITCSVHLARVLVKKGDIVKRGQPVAITGYSGLDGFVTFPWGIPHVHYNVWLNGRPVDPFPMGSEQSLWKAGRLPIPMQQEDPNELFMPSEYDEEKLAEAIASCKTAKVREYLNSIQDIKYRAAETIMEMNYYPTRFPEHINIYKKEHPRTPTLDLPFHKDKFDGVVFVDEVEL
jgi:murein DD-endopeptidase MepM/ murein hydrolase activator NlpD